MNRATPQMREFAAGLMAQQVAEARTADQGGSAAFAVAEKLRLPLETLMGTGGHRALLMRALALAAAEVPWLRGTRVDAEGSLEGPDPSDRPVDPEEMLEGGVVLVAQLTGLLVAFIGERLTLQLVREVWPKLSAKNLNFKI